MRPSMAQVAPNHLSRRVAQVNHSAEDCLAGHCVITQDSRVEATAAINCLLSLILPHAVLCLSYK